MPMFSFSQSGFGSNPIGTDPNFAPIFNKLDADENTLKATAATETANLRAEQQKLEESTKHLTAENLTAPLKEAFDKGEAELKHIALAESEVASQQLRLAEQSSTDSRVGARAQIRAQVQGELRRGLIEGATKFHTDYAGQMTQALQAGYGIELARAQTVAGFAQDVASKVQGYAQAKSSFAMGSAELKVQTMFNMLSLGKSSRGGGGMRATSGGGEGGDKGSFQTVRDPSKDVYRFEPIYRNASQGGISEKRLKRTGYSRVRV